jgi:ATP/maltotriose-dependent transcriptional regulator MalT
LGLRKAFVQLSDAVGDRLSERLRTTPDPEREWQDLASVLALDISESPSGIHLFFDDYHYIAGHAAAESFVAALVEIAPISTLISTRVRPGWISAKHLLYGEVAELGRNALAMTHEEAEAVLGPGIAEGRLSGIMALAEGWPAVIGLAALLPDPGDLAVQAVPEALHDYFAEELYQGMPADSKWDLVRLSIAPSVAPGLTNVLVGHNRVLEDGYKRGFLTRESTSYELHPLLRQFLRGKFDDFSQSALREAARVAGRWYLEHSLWDDAFALASEFELTDLLLDLIEQGIDPALADGRMSTLDAWLTAARRVKPADPAVRLAEIESAFRRGRWRDAESKALRLAADLPHKDPLAARVLFRAGQIAQLDDRQSDALELLTQAHHRAQTETDVRRTMWSRFVTLCDLEEPAQAWQALMEFEQLPPSTLEDVVRARHGRLVWAVRWGGIHEELARHEDTLELLQDVPDPLVRTGFLQSLGTALGLMTRYSEALQIAERQLGEAQESNVQWVEPHALELKGLAQLGLRDFDSAASSLRRAYALGTDQGNLHSQISSVALLARVYLARGELERASALAATDWDRSPSPGMEGDYLATRALICACSERLSDAAKFAEASKAVTDQIDGRVLRMFAEAIIARKQQATDLYDELVASAIRQARTTGNLDAFVCAYRGDHSLLVELDALTPDETDFVQRLVRMIDPQLADKAGFRTSTKDALPIPHEALTPREQEVFGLMRQGLTNRQIGRSIWIEESTVKVHVRNILRKLGARSRTEAVAVGAELVIQQRHAEQAE